ncbi:MAG: extracellular solute-binding protein [Clostridia bacterium]|nr:extracellular solute-binding protein [Clostridia bacterium]
MKDTSYGAVLKSLLAIILIMVMALSMATFVFADEELEDAEQATTEEGDAEDGATDEEIAQPIVTGPAETVTPEGLEDNQSSVSVVGFHRDGRYVDYYNEHLDADKKLPEVLVAGNAVTSGSAKYALAENYEGKSNVLLMEKEGTLVYTVDVAETGMYALELSYFPLLGDGNGKDYELQILIDGKLPHKDAARFSMKRNWTDEDEENPFDSIGNELFSKQVEDAKWLIKDVRDPDGVFDDSVKFYLTKGTHTITLDYISGIMAIASLRLHNEGEGISYNDYIAMYDMAGATDATEEFILEAENYVDKSESLLQPAYDRSDPKVTPYSISKTRLNVFGGESWSTNTQTVNWEINVPADGYYTIGFRYRQSYVEDSTSYRRIYIDGKVPFYEANAIGFPFGIGYNYKVIGGVDENGEEYEYKFYLTKGTHEFSMEVVIGDMAEISRKVEDIVYQLNYVYRKIIIVTGTEPDIYRDYELDKKIVDLDEMLNSIYEDMKSVEQDVIDINGSLGSATILTTMLKQLEDFIEEPYAIPERLSTFKDNISTLGAWMLDLRNMPVQFDKVVFSGSGMEPSRQTANFFENLAHEVRAFWSSFVDDYTSVGAESSTGRSLTVWVGTGRDQAMVLKTLCDNYFTPQTDISVNVSLVPLGILSKAIVASRGPDIALHVGRSEPMNLGVRNAVYDLSQFEDYEEIVSSRFSKYAMVPYTLSTTNDKGEQIKEVYALPETQNFSMMFYRTDIFAELGISPPNTWDEFDNILPYIQANNMTVGLDSHLAQTAPTTGGTFYTFILQNGNTPYTEDGTVTNFTQQYSIDAFQKWTRYYLQYDLPTDYNWYTRFRNGEMPLVLQAYSNITYLQESAPELNGLWEALPIPGTLDEETGIINRTEESTGMSACMIVSKTINAAKDPKQQLEDAWTFMKWWTSDETSADYGNRVEMAIGSVARYTTSNINGFNKIKWSAAEAAAIKEQREWVRETPELVGGYYVGRNLINAFRNVTNNSANPREKLFYYNEQINEEIWRKRSEYNLSVPEEANK